MRRFVIGNWKCYKSLTDARAWIDEFATRYRPIPGLSVVIAPSFICLEGLAGYLRRRHLQDVFLAAQDISPFPKGAYTGAVAADMVRGLADYVLIGHSERRRYFHETVQDVLNKASEALDTGLAPIICIDNPDEIMQLRGLQDSECDKMIIAYQPVEALNFQIPAPLSDVSGAAEHIGRTGFARTVVYGGGVTLENARQYAGITGISGILVGAASLEAASFAAICEEFRAL